MDRKFTNVLAAATIGLFSFTLMGCELDREEPYISKDKPSQKATEPKPQPQQPAHPFETPEGYSSETEEPADPLIEPESEPEPEQPQG